MFTFPPELADFATRALAAGLGSILASVYQFLRTDSSSAWAPSERRSYLYRQLLVAIVSGLIVAGTTSIGARFAFILGVIFPFVLSPISERFQIERERKVALLESKSKAEQAVQDEPQKAKPKWDLAATSLELYIDRNLQQVGNIFWITILVMAVGIALVVYGIWLAYEDHLQVSIVATASGVLTQAIGGTFLLIYRSTMSQASNYVGMLERINSVGMAVEIVDLIADDKKEIKDKARAELVKEILIATRHPQREAMLHKR